MPPKSRHTDPMARPAPPVEDHEEEDEEDLIDLCELMSELSVAERRQVYALKGFLQAYRAKRREFMQEEREMEKKYEEKFAALYRRRHEITSGAADITEEELSKAKALAEKNGDTYEKEEENTKDKGVQIKDPTTIRQEKMVKEAAEKPDGGIPCFWLGALKNSTEVSGMIMERDFEALEYLTNIETKKIGDSLENAASFVITFTFAPNKYFTNTTLTKTYHMEYDEYEDEYQVTNVEGDKIDWTSPKMNLTVTLKQKKQRNKKTKEVRVVEKMEKTESFFNYFKAPKIFTMDKEKEEDDDESEEDDEMFLEQEMEMDIEVAQALNDMIIPQAATFYSGKIIDRIAEEMKKQFAGLFGGEGFGDDDDEEEDEDDEDADGNGGQFSAMVARGRGGRGGAAGGRGGNAGAQQQECKQQ